jgi:hypothetical protein
MNKLRNSLAILSLAFAANSEPVSNIISNCWDGTYQYRVATLAKNGDKVEIGFKGNWNLLETTGDPINDESYLPITNQGRSDHSLYFSFDDKECQKSGDTWTCKASLPDRQWGMSKKFFIERLQYQLDTPLFTITKVSVAEIVVTYGPGQVSAKVIKENWNYDASTAELSFNLMYCSPEGRVGNTFYGTASFPEPLREYLLTKPVF